MKNPLVVLLENHMLASDALYQTRYGAHTIDDAIEMDIPAAKSRNWKIPPKFHHPAFDNYSNAEDDHIDQYGISSGLY